MRLCDHTVVDDLVYDYHDVRVGIDKVAKDNDASPLGLLHEQLVNLFIYFCSF